jgi:hypothetical protein
MGVGETPGGISTGGWAKICFVFVVCIYSKAQLRYEGPAHININMPYRYRVINIVLQARYCCAVCCALCYGTILLSCNLIL